MSIVNCFGFKLLYEFVFTIDLCIKKKKIILRVDTFKMLKYTKTCT